MEIKFKRINRFLKKRAFMAFISWILFLLSACKTIDSNAEHEFSNHVYKPIAFLTSAPPRELKRDWQEIIDGIEIKLRSTLFIGKIVGQNEQKEKFDIKPILKSKFKTYINTLSLTGISDREIASKLEKELGIQYFLFFEFLSFPCTKECNSNQQWLIRLKLIESRSGDLIFWARKKYELTEGIKNSEFYKDLAMKLSLEVVNEFSSRFIIPWHQMRYNNFTLNSNQIDLSNLEI